MLSPNEISEVAQAIVTSPQFENVLTAALQSFVGANAQLGSSSIHHQLTNPHIDGNDFNSQVEHIKEAEFTLEFVSELLGQGFKLAYIAKLFHVDDRKLRYQLQKSGIAIPGAQRMTDLELNNKVSQIVEKFPNAGHKMMKGLFMSSSGGPHITRQRLRTSLNQVRLVRNDPPRMSPIKRRVYHVKGPLTMLHIDGHHKLIKWRFVIHGGIDGFSRLILFLGLSIDNRAATVLDHFLEGVLTYGLPVCVRSDYGLENIGVADMMFAAREEEGLVPFITGKSTHNQRIERLWRDAFQGCLEPFYATFSDLERQHLFNPSENFDIYVLHFVAGQLLESTVSEWKEGWNNHPVSTMNNFSPQQLFTSGLLKMRLDGGHHAELNQDKANIEYAAREALIIREFSDAANRRPVVVVPSYGHPLTKEEEALVLTQFSPSDVTLSNLKEEFVWFKNMAIHIINNRL